MRDIGCIRKIIINNVTVEDQGEYEYRVEGKTPVKLSACLTGIEVIVEKPKIPPKIQLVKSQQKEMICKVGGKISLDFAIEGDPAPKAWTLLYGPYNMAHIIWDFEITFAILFFFSKNF